MPRIVLWMADPPKLLVEEGKVALRRQVDLSGIASRLGNIHDAAEHEREDRVERSDVGRRTQQTHSSTPVQLVDGARYAERDQCRQPDRLVRRDGDACLAERLAEAGQQRRAVRRDVR